MGSVSLFIHLHFICLCICTCFVALPSFICAFPIHFTDEDLKESVLHLLGRTPNRSRVYPKVSFHKMKILCKDNQSAADWVEHMKRKKVIIEEFIDIKPSFKFKDKDGEVINEEWRNWKRIHLFTSTSWDFLLTAISNKYFWKWLTNEAKLCCATFYVDKNFLEVLPLLKTFLRMKNQIDYIGGEVSIRGHECFPMAFCPSQVWSYSERRLSLALLDFHQVTRPKPGHRLIRTSSWEHI